MPDAIICTDSAVSDIPWLGELLTENEHLADDAAGVLQLSLPAALVNLVAPPARSILDPFCGTGSILLEAQALSMTAFGVDSNPRMVGMSSRNLAHFGYPTQVELGDALTTSRSADAMITDLPYGRLCNDFPSVPSFTRQLACAVYLPGRLS
jgi:23S rRNA G2445 N2-methylase RlmL